MFGKKHIKVCSKCSGINIKELDGLIGNKNYTVGCIGVCEKDRNKFYGKVDGNVIECNTKDDLIHVMKEALK